jgi:hypothetical protein
VSSPAHTSSSSSAKERACINEQPKGLGSAIYSAIGLLLQIIIEYLVRLTGRRANADESPRQTSQPRSLTHEQLA